MLVVAMHWTQKTLSKMARWCSFGMLLQIFTASNATFFAILKSGKALTSEVQDNPYVEPTRVLHANTQYSKDTEVIMARQLKNRKTRVRGEVGAMGKDQMGLFLPLIFFVTEQAPSQESDITYSKIL